MNTKHLLLKDIVPDFIISILQRIEHHGFHGFIVGGAIRDLLLGRVPVEYDLASNAPPNEIAKIFESTSFTGIKFGTITIHFDGRSVEITTFRKETNYTDFRHPDQLEYVDNIDDDLARRDFTINAMAYQPLTDKLIDLYNGQLHLEQRKLICVGTPSVRFNEDSLRPFRCFRLMSQLGFSVDPAIIDSLRTLVGIPLPAIERIRQEMDRLLMGQYWFSAIQLMASTGWFDHWLGSSVNLTQRDLPHDLRFRWAWFFSFGDFEALSTLFQFSKKDIRFMKHVIDWDFDEDAIGMTVHDLAVSSQRLRQLGFSGPALGKVQLALLYHIRSKDVLNEENDLIQYLDQLNIK